MATTQQKVWEIYDRTRSEKDGRAVRLQVMIGGEREQVLENAARLLGRNPEEISVHWTGEYKTVCCGG